MNTNTATKPAHSFTRLEHEHRPTVSTEAAAHYAAAPDFARLGVPRKRPAAPPSRQWPPCMAYGGNSPGFGGVGLMPAISTTTAPQSAPNGPPASQAVPHFAGTTNPRHLRALEALQRGPVHREALDVIAGCSNGPELVAELRRRGLEIPCQRINVRSIYGRATRCGLYALSERDSDALARWQDDAQPQRVDTNPGAGILRLLALVGLAL